MLKFPYSTPTKSFQKRSALYRSGYHAFDNIFLAYKIYNNDRNDINHDTCHHRSHLYMSKAASEILDCHGNGTILLDIKNKRRQKVVIPYPHQFKDCSGNNGWFQNWYQNLEIYLQRTASVNKRRLLNFQRNSFYKTCKQSVHV